MKITIDGLTRRQKVLCDIMWACGDNRAVDIFIQSLPALDQQEARMLKQMMVLAFLDTVTHVNDDVVALLKQFTLKG